MEAIVLDNIPFKLELKDVLQALKMESDDDNAECVAELVEKANSIGKPKATFKLSEINSKGEDHVVVDGVKLTSRELRASLDTPKRVFPFVATCGTELEDWSEGLSDMLDQYWAGIIKDIALCTAIEYTMNKISSEFVFGKVSQVNPGTHGDWSTSQQIELFEILDNPSSSVGVKLVSSLMYPATSMSGILFTAEK